ncbi:MAG: tRNA (adenosine(37)-N6)-threonylcarbamoyltransferase complex ATPase subunit type 1 TsaE [Chloroflexota bacterium]|nr:tRNA (adenosine(37)-N6)-threonylcarbamoyltransferase complex ATPase subunit type 1 TsaE [Chloroflexota bacterium]
MAIEDIIVSDGSTLPIPEEALSLISHSAEQTQEWGQVLAPLLEQGDILCLVGELGTGKTCFAQGVGQGLGVSLPITSPTFIRVREYEESSISLPFYHIDLYRVAGEGEARGWGLEEYLYGEGVCAIEWAERIRALLPPSCLWIYFQHGQKPEIRHISWWAEKGRGQRLLAQFREGVLG